MRKPFDGEFTLTQGFNDPCCRLAYAQFGLNGHNGLDFGCPSGTRILAPHDGVVIESTLDPEGYGIYVKIENSVEGSVLAHFREARVGVGDGVKEGDIIGYSDNSGNSTGPHLHWGYYRFPRDRQNGFNGFIDQTPYIGTGIDYQAQYDQCRIDRDSHWNDRTAIADRLKVENNMTIILSEIEKLLSYKEAVIQKDKQLLDIQKQAAELQEQLTAKEQDIKDAQAQVGTLTVEVEKAQRMIDDLIKQTKEDQIQLADLQHAAQIHSSLTGFRKWIFDIFIR